MTDAGRLDTARRTIAAQIEALEAVAAGSLDTGFERAVEAVAAARGHVVVTGVGKSGIVGRKIAATLASLGAPAFFVHATEASHGDLGMITPETVVLAVSNSGESRELRDLLVYCKRTGVTVIAITRAPDSLLGSSADIVVRLPNVAEGGPHGPAPMASTTATLAIGDALAACAAERKRFTPEEFGLRHPGGLLGLRLQTVGEWLAAARGASALPLVGLDASPNAVIEAVSGGLSGCAGVVDEAGVLNGIITDGDIRRALGAHAMDWTARAAMTADPRTIDPGMRMGEVIDIFTEKRIANAFVTDAEGKPIGLIHVKDLMEQGFL